MEEKPAGGRGDVVVEVTAHQFYGSTSTRMVCSSFDTLYLPVNRKATLILRSEDVDHSWWVPELTGKRDAIPGVTNELHFTPREVAVFDNGVCGEFCGIQHARMTTRVEVLEQGDWEAWLADNEQAELAASARRSGQRRARSATASRERVTSRSARRSPGTGP